MRPLLATIALLLVGGILPAPASTPINAFYIGHSLASDIPPPKPHTWVVIFEGAKAIDVGVDTATTDRTFADGVLIFHPAMLLQMAEVEALAQEIIARHQEQVGVEEAYDIFRESAFCEDVTDTTITGIPERNGKGVRST